MAIFQEREDELENQLNRGALWAITYGDMMSYLMIFFLIMFVFNSTNKDMTHQLSAQALEEAFGSKSDKMKEIFSKYGIQQIARVDINRNRLRITFSAPVLFNSGSADLKAASLPHLQALAASLKELPNQIQVEGHTDAQPMGPSSPYKTNWELSAARAFSVTKLLIQEGVPPQRLAAIGYGEYQPRAPNDTEENRAANRRIEVNIIRQGE